MTIDAYTFKKQGVIEQVPTHMHYLGEREVYMYTNTSPVHDHIILSGGRYYLSSDPIGKNFYHIRLENALYAFDSLRSYKYWDMEREVSQLKTVEDCELFAANIGYTLTKRDYDVYRYENDMYVGWSSLENLPTNLLDVARRQINHLQPLISAKITTKPTHGQVGEES